MDKLVIVLIALCSLSLVTSSELSIHDYDIQIHPIHGHHGYHGDHGEHGYATSVRYDKRYHHKVPVHAYGHDDDAVYQYVSDDHHEEDDDHGYHGY